MQPLVVEPRETLTEDDVTGLITAASGVTIGCGCELLDLSLNVLEDISADFRGGSVSRASYANLHGTAKLSISRELPYAWAILRPYLTMTDGTTTARFRLGAYYTNTPARSLAERPVTYEVECYDILSILDDQVGDAYAVAEGTSYLVAVEQILQSRGVTEYIIDQQSAATLPTDRVWTFDDTTTWLGIVNDLLGSIGYAGIWFDWDGRLRAEPYTSPRDRAPEWTYDTGSLTSMLGVNRVAERDFTNAPNRWVFVRQNNADDFTPPTEGDGIYTVTNDLSGDTSIAGRRRTITKKVMLDAADQESLVAAAQRTIDADTSIPVKIAASTFPNPLHWHFDVAYLDDPAFGPPVNILVTRWTLPLSGGDQTHEWTVLAP